MLKTLLMRQKIDLQEQKLRGLNDQSAVFATREAELAAAVSELTAESSAEDRAAVEQLVNELESERSAHNEAVAAATAELDQMRSELAELERAAEPPKPQQQTPAALNNTERTDFAMATQINIRSLPMSQRAFDAYPMEQRQAIVAQPDVKEFLSQIRSFRDQQRAVTGAALTIPTVMLDLISENMFRYSKLMRHLRVRNVKGQARQPFMGPVPEGVWTEMCAYLNEVDLNFMQVTLDGFKVAAFTAICNAQLDDSDINLFGAIAEALSEGVGLAKDKAILYGKGAGYHMPMGIVTRLAQTAQPSGYPADAPAWVDLHTSNVLSIGGAGVTGAEFWAALMAATGATYTTYSRGEMFWAMNSRTLATLRSKLITFSASGDIVANLYNALPIVTGQVEVLEFIPDGDIIGGYGDLYLWLERAGMTVESARQIIPDNTIIAAKSRADGAPIVPGAFVAININGASVTTAVNFAADKANDAMLAGLTLSGVTLAPTFDGGVLTYTGTTTTANAKIEAVAAQPGAEIGITFNGAPVRNGGTVTQTSGAGNVYAIAVKQGNATRVYTVTVTATLG